MVYTRWKCDRLLVYSPKYFASEYATPAAMWTTFFYLVWKLCGIVSEETERLDMHTFGYPWWRDPITLRKQDKYRSMIRDNDIDIMDPKWTGVSKAQLK